MAAMIHRGPGRRRHPARLARRRRHAPPQHRRFARRQPAGLERNRNTRGRLQRRNLQFPRTARGARSAGPSVPHALRYGSCGSRLRVLGRAVPRTSERNVCIRGRRTAAGSQRTRGASLPGPRPDGHQAALLRAHRWQAPFRLRSARVACKRLRSRANLLRGNSRLFALRFCLRAVDADRRSCVSSAGPFDEHARRRAGNCARAKALLGCPAARTAISDASRSDTFARCSKVPSPPISWPTYPSACS